MPALTKSNRWPDRGVSGSDRTASPRAISPTGTFKVNSQCHEATDSALRQTFVKGIDSVLDTFAPLMDSGDPKRDRQQALVQYALMARRMTSEAMVVVPGYHLGEHEQQFHLSRGYSEQHEQRLLEGIDWQRNGYRLFEISCLSGANPNGIFHPFMECNCLFLDVEVFRDIGQADERFDLPGGGALNLYIYRKAAMHPHTRSFMLAGEGSFHQLHGGVTTSEVAERETILNRQRE